MAQEHDKHATEASHGERTERGGSMEMDMKKILYGISAIAFVSALSACGGNQAADNNIAAENDANAMMADSNGMTNMSGHDMNDMSGRDMNDMDNMSNHDMNNM